MSGRDSRERFGDRVERYTKYRPDYPADAGAALRARFADSDSPHAADIGSGTGKFTRVLLDAGFTVSAVEPNGPMRREAERILGGYSGFHSVSGDAVNTRLEARSIDLICAAQAFHWFSGPDAVTEFDRIIKPGGLMALIWNDRKTLGDEFHERYDSIVRTRCPDYKNSSHKSFDENELKGIFTGRSIETLVFPNFQEFDLTGLCGRLESSSYCPLPGEPAHAPLMKDLEELFGTFQSEGSVRFEYSTTLYIIS